MRIYLLLVIFIIQISSHASELIEGHIFVTRAEYQNLGRPCACPSDRASRGKCGRRAALCRNGGENILDCGSIKVKTIKDYKKIKKELCGVDF